jgi:predicted nuclease of predicted toxin-antitoxin system
MEWARTHGRVVVTQDLGFGTILEVTGAVAPSVAQLRADDLIDSDTADRVLAALQKVRDPPARGAPGTIDLFRTRIRLLPIGD